MQDDSYRDGPVHRRDKRAQDAGWPAWAPSALIGIMLLSGTAIGISVLRMQWRIDQLESRLVEVQPPTARASVLATVESKLAEIDRNLADLRLRIDRLAVPLCRKFHGRSLIGSETDDQPADPKLLTADQWRRLAALARYMPASVCIEDLRADQETDGEQELEAVLHINDGRVVEVDLKTNSEVSEVELLVAFNTLPAPLRKATFDHGCRRPRKAELSIRAPVKARDVRWLLDWWQPGPTGRYPSTLSPKLIVELDCGSTYWDLELKSDGTIERTQRPQ